MGGLSTGDVSHKGEEEAPPKQGFVRPGGGRRGYHNRGGLKNARGTSSDWRGIRRATSYDHDNRMLTRSALPRNLDSTETVTPQPFVYPGGGRRSKSKSLLPKLRIKGLLGGMKKSSKLKGKAKEEESVVEDPQVEEQGSNFAHPRGRRERHLSSPTASPSPRASTSTTRDGASDQISLSTFGRSSATPSSSRATTRDGASDAISLSNASSLFGRTWSVASGSASTSRCSSRVDLELGTQSYLGDHEREIDNVPTPRPKTAGDAEKKKTTGRGSWSKGIVRRREKGQGWSGEWNQKDIQIVIEKLRGLK